MDSKFIILSGAGVSTNAGIPDYQSDKEKSQALIDLFWDDSLTDEQFNSDPRYHQFKEDISKARPTLSHIFPTILAKEGRLKRVYTQNVDCLYQKAGLPSEYLVEFHGSIEKDNIVRGDTEISEDVITQLLKDTSSGDGSEENLTVIIMGTSLRSYPFAAIVNMFPPGTTRILVDNHASKLASIRYQSDGYLTFVTDEEIRKVSIRRDFGTNPNYKDIIYDMDTDNFCSIFLDKLWPR